MFDKVLIANRGEIANRIQHACHCLGLRTVVVFSEADRDADYVHQADQALCIGPAPARDSYMHQERLLLAASLSDAGAIHPGYGFLSENADFAERVERSGLTFIGPSAACIRIMGDKIAAKHAMRDSGVPCVPGSDGALPCDNTKTIKAIAQTIGYPVIIKAAGGGGGRGMRIVNVEQDLLQAVEITREEARLSFGNPEIYLEKYLSAPRHIEIQVLCDQHGHALWLGSRDCSLQRRHQKLMEEAPAPGLPADVIAHIGQRCVNACLRIGYHGVGTFEFLYEKGEFYFIEMNTRLQVEHPVTEMITGIDIVQQQLLVALGKPLAITQHDIACQGHAIECRINAEHPQTFMPQPGTITCWVPPEGMGIRVDSHITSGYSVPPYYDSMIAKLIAHGASREEALHRMHQALKKVSIEGIDTNIPLHLRVLATSAVQQGGVDIHYLEDWLARQHTASKETAR